MSDNGFDRRSFLKGLGVIGAALSFPATTVALPSHEVAVPILEQVGTEIITPRDLDTMLHNARLGGWHIRSWAIEMRRDEIPFDEPFDEYKYMLAMPHQPELTIQAVWVGDRFDVERHADGRIVAGGLPLPTSLGRPK